MKRVLGLLVSLLLLATLFGCNKEPAETTGSTETPVTDAPTTSATTPVSDTTAATNAVDTPLLRLPLTTISMPLIQEDVTAEDGTVIFTRIYQDAALIAPDAQAAEDVVMNLLNQIDLGQSYAEEILGWAQEYYDPEEVWYPYSHQLLYNPTRIDEKILSLYGAEVTYSGGNHPNHIGVSATFDMVSSELLQLSDVLEDSAAATDLSQLIIEDLTANRKDYQLYDGYATVVNERYGGVAANWMEQPAWYFSNKGICVYFSPYDIAPYVTGQIVVEIPYSQLEGIVRADFLPAELPDAAGTIAAALAQDLDLEQFSQFSEVILDESGERFVLYADDLVTNITMERGNWTDDGTLFQPTSTVFMASTLCNGDAIIVQDQFPDTLPWLRLTYESGGNTYIKYLSQSGKDGSILILDIE